MIYPGAAWRPLPENATQPLITPRVFILHSQACKCGDSLFDDFDRSGNTLESTGFIQSDGGVEQYMDTMRRADANLDANDFANSWETQDDGDPDNQPWTPAQVDSIVAVARWSLDVHPTIARQRCDGPYGSGVGYHTMWGAPSPWTPVSKTCPGRVRIEQFNDEVLPRILAAEEEEVTPEQEAKLDLIIAKLDRTSPSGVSLTHDYAKEVHLNVRDWVMPKMGEIDGQVDALVISGGVVDIDALADAVADRIAERLAS